ncbi:MAG: hypothetical protein KME38_25120 [Spirirestis rafaelensis WJT71-NPBG6]|nr:hypothetical protein [Spirirestis rafaelensis WJT71-NPBG6]
MQLHNNLELWTKDSIVTNGINSKEIPNVCVCEDVDIPGVMEKLKDVTKQSYPQEEIFGTYCTVCEYIQCPVDMAFEYAANIYSMEEWTYSVRQLKHIGGGLYKGLDFLGDNTYIYIRAEAYPDSKVVDFPCAWDQGQELWMRYHYRFLDAMPTLRKPGTIMLWTNCKHPYYERNVADVPSYISESRNRTDREWIGDFWPYFYPGHQLEARNMKAILEYRFANG